MIPPDAQRAMSKRAGATVVEVKGSHAIYVSQPRAVADLIETGCDEGDGRHRLESSLRTRRIYASSVCPFRRLHTFCCLRPARLLPPVFGYGAPHLSVRGTLALLNNALLSTHSLRSDSPTRLLSCFLTSLQYNRCASIRGRNEFQATTR